MAEAPPENLEEQSRETTEETGMAEEKDREAANRTIPDVNAPDEHETTFTIVGPFCNIPIIQNIPETSNEQEAAFIYHDRVLSSPPTLRLPIRKAIRSTSIPDKFSVGARTKNRDGEKMETRLQSASLSSSSSSSSSHIKTKSYAERKRETTDEEVMEQMAHVDIGSDADTPDVTTNTNDAGQTHLQQLLQDYKEVTKNFTEEDRIDQVIQLPYIAIGYFNNEEGGRLSLDTYKVHLYIPSGAIPKGPPRMVYIYVNPEEPHFDETGTSEVVLTPMVQCGPTGLTFEDSVVLSYPHYAQEKSDWIGFSARMCLDEGGSPRTWKSLDCDKDGMMVSSKGNEVILLVSHFTGYDMVGNPGPSSSIMVQVGAFGTTLYDPLQTGYCFRVHVWKAECFTRVEDMEANMDCKLLDAYRGLDFEVGQGDLAINIETITGGWSLQEAAKELSKCNVLNHQNNSVTCYMTKEQPCPAEHFPHCDVLIFQKALDSKWKGNTVKLLLRPNQIFSTPPCPRTKSDKERKETMRLALREKIHGQIDGSYGGLQNTTVYELCTFFDQDRPCGVTWIDLVQHTFGLCYNEIILAKDRLKHPTKEFLKIFFAGRAKEKVADKKAVDDLVDIFKVLRVEEAIRIVQADDSSDREAENRTIPDVNAPDELDITCTTVAPVGDKPDTQETSNEQEASAISPDMETIQQELNKEVHGEIDDDYGGLKETTVCKLCTLIDQETPCGVTWMALVEYCIGLRLNEVTLAQKRLNYPTKEVLKIYFAGRAMENVSTKKAVDDLVKKLQALQMGEAIRIIEADGCPDKNGNATNASSDEVK